MKKGSWTAFMWACYKGHTQTAKVLLDHGADPNAQGLHHMTSLVWASGRGHTEIVKLLLSKGAKVNLGDKFGTTPLIWACRKGFIEISELLLSHGANVDATGMVRKQNISLGDIVKRTFRTKSIGPNDEAHFIV